jgi:hypothetical protein
MQSEGSGEDVEKKDESVESVEVYLFVGDSLSLGITH